MHKQNYDFFSAIIYPDKKIEAKVKYFLIAFPLLLILQTNITTFPVKIIRQLLKVFIIKLNLTIQNMLKETFAFT